MASLFVLFVCLTGWGGLWMIALGLCVVIGQVGVLTSNCMTDLMSRYPNNAGAAAALFGAVQLAVGALASFIVGQFSGASPAGIGYIIGVTGVIGYVGKMLIVRVHARRSAAPMVPKHDEKQDGLNDLNSFKPRKYRCVELPQGAYNRP